VLALFVEQGVERLGLRDRAREAVLRCCFSFLFVFVFVFVCSRDEYDRRRPLLPLLTIHKPLTTHQHKPARALWPPERLADQADDQLVRH
jgi:hypothetical protein